MKAGSGPIAILFLVGAAFGLLAPRPGAAAKPRPPSESERIKALPEEERQWLTEFVAPIILEEEKKAFLDLEAPYQREVFKREFWERRELPDLPSPLGPGYRFRYQDLRQLADEKYDGWRGGNPGAHSPPGAEVQRLAGHRQASADRRRSLPLPSALGAGERPVHPGVLEAPLLKSAVGGR